MVTRLLFAALLTAIALTVVYDLTISRHNERKLNELGAKTCGGGQTRAYALLAFVWALSGSAEVFLLGRSIYVIPAVLGITALALARHLRTSARTALGQRWTLGIVSLPGHPLVTGRIYDRMRHPEYVGTFLMFVGAPLLHGAWLTFAASAMAGAVLLFLRVRLEERVLDHDARYLALLGDRPRFIPRRPREVDREPSRPTRLDPRARGNLPGRS